MTLLPHLFRPTRGGAAGVIIVFALCLSLAAKAGWFGLPLSLILLSWFFKYAYILFDATVRGVDEPPALDIQMLNPLDEQRPLAQLAIVGVVLAAVVFLKTRLGSAVAVATTVISLALLPASVAVLGLEGNPLKAIYPPALLQLVRGLGWLYPAVLALIAGYGMALFGLDRLELWLPVQLAAGMFAVLSVFSTLAGVIYERRDALGLETWHSPERKAERLRQEQLRQSDRVVDDAYGQMRADAHVRAWQTLQNWLASRGHAPEDFQWLCGRVGNWGDSRYVTRLHEEYVDRLLTLQRNGEALDVVTQRLRADPNFRPKSAAATLQVAGIAARGGAPRVARVLLADFAQRFQGDPQIDAAAALMRELPA
jgi:hypothetical protein